VEIPAGLGAGLRGYLAGYTRAIGLPASTPGSTFCGHCKLGACVGGRCLPQLRLARISGYWRPAGLGRKRSLENSPDWGMFKLLARRENPEICGSFRSLQPAGFVGIFIPVQTPMNIVEIETASVFQDFLGKDVSSRPGCINRGLPSTLRYAS
jgi:hypothetical protein